MSAFVVSDAHINALLNSMAGFPNNFSHAKLSEMGRVLIAANIKSVAYRYREPAEKEAADIAEAQSFKFRLSYAKKPVEVIKACAGYDYQACEAPDYWQSEAAEIIAQIRKAAISRLPGYADAEWHIQEESGPVLVSLSEMAKVYVK